VLLALQVLLHLGVLLLALHLARLLELGLGGLVGLVGLHDLLQRLGLAAEARQLLVVGEDLRPRQVGLDLAVALNDRLEAIDQAACASSPSLAAFRAAMATSSMSSVGSRVVNFCV